MNISTRGLIEIISHEGICLDPYLDSVGVWTTGIGQTKSDDIDPKKMGRLTLQQAIDLFKRKIVQYTSAVDALGLTLTQYQYDALSSFCYNVGPGNLRSLCKNRSLAQIGEAFSLYHKPPEIADRRNKEQALFRTGKYSNADGKVLVFPVSSTSKPQYAKGQNIDIRPYFDNIAAPADDATPLGDPPTLRKGCNGLQVQTLQGRLNAHGYSLVVDGAFGNKTDAALRSFQKAAGLPVTGVADHATWAELNK